MKCYFCHKERKDSDLIQKDFPTAFIWIDEDGLHIENHEDQKKPFCKDDSCFQKANYTIQ